MIRQLILLPWLSIPFLFLVLNASAEDKPNIFILQFHSLRYDALAAEENQSILPNVQSFIADSVFFANAFSPSTDCAGSYLSLLTGNYPTQYLGSMNAVAGNYYELGYKPDTQASLPYLLGNRQYRTRAILETITAEDSFSLSTGYHHFETAPEYYAFSYANHAIRYITSEPELLILQTDLFSNKKNNQVFFAPVEGKPDLVTYQKNLYRGGLVNLDTMLGIFFDTLRLAGCYDNSIIIFLADHGYDLSDRGESLFRYGHCLYDYMIHIPLMIKFPHGQYKGSKVELVVRTIDILPTILELLNVDYDPTAIQGKSLLPILQNSESMDRLVYSINLMNRAYQISVRTKTHKIIHTPHIDFYRDPTNLIGTTFQFSTFQPYEFYDLTRDAEEKSNQFTSDERMVKEMIQYLNAFRQFIKTDSLVLKKGIPLLDLFQ